MFLDHTQRRTTVGRTPLDEWSARRRDLYLTTHDTQNRQISMPPVGFEPTISAGERPLYRRLSGPQGRFGKCGHLRESIPTTVDPVASRYTDYAVAAHRQSWTDGNCTFMWISKQCNPLCSQDSFVLRDSVITDVDKSSASLESVFWLQHFSLIYYFHFFFSVALWPNAGHGLLILDVSRSHTTTHHRR